MIDLQSELTIDAQRLLNYLRNCAASRAQARTDRQIAAALELPERVIVRLADELLTHGVAVIATCAHPMGRWLLTGGASDEDWAEARKYVEVLAGRAKRIFTRRQHAEAALRRTEARRRVESTGQRRLF